MSERQALASGVVVGSDYEIERVLGAGGFGITYLARDLQLGHNVAIKEYFPVALARRMEGATVAAVSQGGGVDFDWGLDRFLAEARTLALLAHPNIARVMRYFRENGTAYMVLEFIEGLDFEAWLRKLGRPPTQAELDTIVGPVLDALETVHGAAIVHRDIKPENISIRSSDGAPVLLDFGAAKKDLGEHAAAHATAAFVSPGYSPPESYDGEGHAQGAWTDIYAFAATLYRALAGSAPQRGKSREVDDTYVPLTQRIEQPEAYRPAFLAAIDQGLSVARSERPATVAAWRRELFATSIAPAVGGHDGVTRLQAGVTRLLSDTGAGGVERPDVTVPPNPQNGLFRGVMAGLGVIVVLLGLFQIYQSFDEPAAPVPGTQAQPAPQAPPAAPRPPQQAAARPAPQQAPQPVAPAQPQARPAQPPVPTPAPAVPAPQSGPPQQLGTGRTATTTPAPAPTPPSATPARPQQGTADRATRFAAYRNPRFGFSLRYPSDLVKPGTPPANGGGLAFNSADGSFTVAAFAHFNTDDQDAAGLLAQLRQDNAIYRTAPTLRANADGFVISAVMDGRQHIHYALLSCKRQVVNVLEINLARPSRAASPLVEIADQILQSFQVGRGEDSPEDCPPG